MKLRTFMIINAQLQHRDIGIGVHDLERNPCSVVKATNRVDRKRIALCEQPSNLFAKCAGIRGVVGHLVEPRVEAAKVVDHRRRCFGRRETERRLLPVGAHDQDRGWLGKRLRPIPKLLNPEWIIEHGRRPMTQEDCRHCSIGRCPESVLGGSGNNIAHEPIERLSANALVRGARHGSTPL